MAGVVRKLGGGVTAASAKSNDTEQKALSSSSLPNTISICHLLFL